MWHHIPATDLDTGSRGGPVPARCGTGHEVVPFKPVDVISGIHLFLALLTADGASGTLAALQHETVSAPAPSLRFIFDGGGGGVVV
eukprot:1598070-Rhodomonas_salina.1